MQYEGNVYNHHLIAVRHFLSGCLAVVITCCAWQQSLLCKCVHASESVVCVCMAADSVVCVCVQVSESVMCVCMAAKSVMCVCVQVSEAAHVHTHSPGQEQRHGCGEWGEQWGPGPAAHSVPSPLCPTDPGNLHRYTQAYLSTC